MPRDEQKRQKSLMKKRSKQKAIAHNKPTAPSVSAPAIIRQARAFPLIECWISDNWDKQNDVGLIQVLIARQQPDGNVCFASYLIDKFLLGVKNTLGNADFSLNRYKTEVADKVFRELTPEKCSPELAHQMVYAALEYAEQFGFAPEKDFAVTQYMLTPRGELEEPYTLTFGKDGKPFFVAGPYDNAAHILRQLEKTAGPGNYHYLVMTGEI